MKSQLVLTLATLAFVPVSSVIADCNSNMPYNELVDCIVVEGSGENYQERKAHIDKEDREHQQDC